MVDDPHYQMFSSLLRTSQEMMWSSMQKPVERTLPELIDKSKAANDAGGTLRLDADAEIPPLPPFRRYSLPAGHRQIATKCGT